MSDTLADELRSLAERLATFAGLESKPEYAALFERVWNAAEAIGRSWSGSNLGYHAWVHYVGLLPPPSGARWSLEWGDMRGTFSGGGSVGDWREFNPDDVLATIYKRAGDPDLNEMERSAAQAQKEFEADRREAKSILEAAKSLGSDRRLDEILKEIDDILVFTLTTAIKVQLPGGDWISHDLRAIGGGWQGAPHQQVFAAAAHLDRRDRVSPAKVKASSGNRIFIGHGRSAAWRALKDFLEDRLGLLTEEFNRVSPAGVATANRLEEMLESSGMAFLVLTAEDEHGDKLTARQNVIHEAGLFQGRLGFKRAIILREETCEEFSNIHGLGQLPFQVGRISAVFEDVREVLEREGMTSPPSKAAK
jgi:hypothetical protein